MDMRASPAIFPCGGGPSGKGFALLEQHHRQSAGQHARIEPMHGPRGYATSAEGLKEARRRQPFFTPLLDELV
jgi:hypothetical protein